MGATSFLEEEGAEVCSEVAPAEVSTSIEEEGSEGEGSSPWGQKVEEEEGEEEEEEEEEEEVMEESLATWMPTECFTLRGGEGEGGEEEGLFPVSTFLKASDGETSESKRSCTPAFTDGVHTRIHAHSGHTMCTPACTYVLPRLLLDPKTHVCLRIS